MTQYIHSAASVYKCLTLKLLFSVVTFKVSVAFSEEHRTHIQIKRFIKCVYTVHKDTHATNMSNAISSVLLLLLLQSNNNNFEHGRLLRPPLCVILCDSDFSFRTSWFRRVFCNHFRSQAKASSSSSVWSGCHRRGFWNIPMNFLPKNIHSHTRKCTRKHTQCIYEWQMSL